MRLLVVIGHRGRRLGWTTLIVILTALTGWWAWINGAWTGARGYDRRFPLAGRLIALDPGHGGIDGGCSFGPWREKDLALDIVRRLRPLLHAAGARVFLTRERDHDLSFQGEGSFRQRRDLSGRVALVRRSGAEVLVSVHLNAALNPRLSGPITFYQSPKDRGPGRRDADWAEQAGESRRLAGLLQEELRALYPGCDEWFWPHTFYLLRHAPCPTALVEVGYLSHPGDRQRLLAPRFRQRIAAALAAGLRRYFAGERPTE
ncbi:MAG TPA: N-acetylmuramoyl-L-alanine amidase CwlD [Firmicutes bacterium]|nr:N-acetylmuramoyl-L-alanine amidase CwlD [Bacillota bacterium]